MILYRLPAIVHKTVYTKMEHILLEDSKKMVKVAGYLPAKW